MKSAALLLTLALSTAAHAATFRWASIADHSSADPHGQNQIVNNAINGQVYEPLVKRGKKLEIIPGLAESWTQVSPTVWRFNLRKGVKWHDGSVFTADDVVFSVKRVQGDTSTFRVYGRQVGEPRKVDASTVEFTTPRPNPVMLETVSLLAIMSKAWCEAHGVARAQDFGKGEETYASRNAMGTGPYMLTAREPDVKSTFKRNPRWWGTFEGNVDEIVYRVIKSDATRMAALAAGDIDFVLDPPSQDIERLSRDPKIRVYRAPENLVFFLGMNQSRTGSPFRDVRVRRAIYQAIDTEAINRVVMRGLAVAAGIPLPNPEAAGVDPALNTRVVPYDLAAARRLLAEAGYKDGFSTQLDCQSVRDYICIAVAGMLARVDVKVKVNSLANARYFAKGQALDMNFFLLGWGGPNNDAMFTLQPLLHGRNATGDGDFNWGDYRDEKMDALIDVAKVEMDGAKRKKLIDEAYAIERQNVYNIPLHRRMAPWASRANVEMVHRPDSWVEVRWVRLLP
ncbi:MAG: ABC transporter substrate-binding protein [Usitatibacter sp.]